MRAGAPATAAQNRSGAPETVPDDSGECPERTAMGRELEKAIGAALELLPMPQRAALELKALGHSLEEIADALEITANYAGVLIHRARQAMARHLAPFIEERAG